MSDRWTFEDESEPLSSSRGRWRRPVAVALVVILVAPILITTALRLLRALG